MLKGQLYVLPHKKGKCEGPSRTFRLMDRRGPAHEAQEKGRGLRQIGSYLVQWDLAHARLYP